jgi:hypothetical protein
VDVGLDDAHHGEREVVQRNGGLQAAGLDVLGEQPADERDEPGLEAAGGHGEQPQRQLAFLVQKAAHPEVLLAVADEAGHERDQAAAGCRLQPLQA